MNHFHRLVLLWGSLVLASDPNIRFERKLRGWDTLDRTTGNLATYPGTDPGADVQDVMRREIGYHHVGVLVRVRNFSPFKLTDPRSHVTYGWEENGDYFPGYQGHSAVAPGTEDIFIFHNKGWTTEKTKRNSMGKLSWRIGEDTTVRKGEFTYMVRLTVSWHVFYTTCANTEGHGNGVSVDLVKVGEKWEQGRHDYEETRGQVEDGPRVVIREFDSTEIQGLSARAKMTMGCQAVLTLDVVAPTADMERGEVAAVLGISKDHPVAYVARHLEEGNMFAYMALFAGFLAALMAVCGIVSCIRKSCRKRRVEEYRGGEGGNSGSLKPKDETYRGNYTSLPQVDEEDLLPSAPQPQALDTVDSKEEQERAPPLDELKTIGIWMGSTKKTVPACLASSKCKTVNTLADDLVSIEKEFECPQCCYRSNSSDVIVRHVEDEHKAQNQQPSKAKAPLPKSSSIVSPKSCRNPGGQAKQ